MAFRIALTQINPIVGDFEGNTAKIIAFIERAKTSHADLIAFPELALCGYPPEDLVFKPAFLKDSLHYLKKVIHISRGISVIVGLVDKNNKNVYNSAAFIHNHKLIDIYHKILLPNYGVFDEKRYFQQGEICSVYQIGEMAIGVNICEDIWSPAGPARIQSQFGGSQLIINISASPYHERKLIERQRMFAARARENDIYVVYVNMAGGQDELVFDGGSMVIDPKGNLIARAKEFQEDFLLVNIPLMKPKSTTPSQSDRLINTFIIKPLRKDKARTKVTPVINKKLFPLEEIYSALVLGTRDYIIKNGFSHVVLGLSGGIDSALVAAIAADAIGRDNVTALTMPSIYSSSETKNDSEIIARNLGIDLMKIPISDILQSYLVQLKSYFIGRQEDITEENIQARIRGNLLMAVSNKFDWLVLGTGNKSETSVGYCTLYGDMAAGFAVIKDIPKTLVYELAKYCNQKTGKDTIPKSVIRRAPSAELRPNQKDEDSLPPYDILDPILKDYIENHKSIAEIIKHGFPRRIVEKVACLVNTNEYKRRQSPPGVKITPLAFGRDRRMPITNKFIS